MFSKSTAHQRATLSYEDHSVATLTVPSRRPLFYFVLNEVPIPVPRHAGPMISVHPSFIFLAYVFSVAKKWGRERIRMERKASTTHDAKTLLDPDIIKQKKKEIKTPRTLSSRVYFFLYRLSFKDRPFVLDSTEQTAEEKSPAAGAIFGQIPDRDAIERGGEKESNEDARQQLGLHYLRIVILRV